MSVDSTDTVQSRSRRSSRRWLGLAVASLFAAGGLALVLVLGRAPHLNQVITDPLMAKRCLVVHVDLALLVWLFSFASAMTCLLHQPAVQRWAARSAWMAAAGVVAMVAGGAMPGARPVLSDYIPVLHEPVFLCGLVLFAIAIGWHMILVAVSQRSEPRTLPWAVAVGLRSTAVLTVTALATMVITVCRMPRSMPVDSYWEAVMWGGGHVLQFANTAAMLSAWVWLSTRICGRCPLSPQTANRLFAWLVLPAGMAPAIALAGPTTTLYRVAFTRLMQFGIAGPVACFLVLVAGALLSALRRGEAASDGGSAGALTGWFASASLLMVGVALGTFIRTSTTLVPAHYHACIGAVTVAFMATAPILLEWLGVDVAAFVRAPWLRLQPALFGCGQLVFVLGFAYGGVHGLARKVYGAEQHIRTLEQSIGLAVMGVGGAMAVLGGVTFLVIMARVWRAFRPGDRAVKAIPDLPQDSGPTKALAVHLGGGVRHG